MTQDVTAILDGIKKSVEAVGRSGSDEIYLDNVSFRINASKLDIPHDSDLTQGREDVETLFSAFDFTDYPTDEGRVFINDSEIAPDIVTFQTLPAEWMASGPRIDMTVNLSSSDVTNSLPQDVLLSQLFLHELTRQLEVKPGRITFNVSFAYVLWEDAEQLVEFEIEIPR